jgi:hypothetical protein
MDQIAVALTNRAGQMFGDAMLWVNPRGPSSGEYSAAQPSLSPQGTGAYQQEVFEFEPFSLLFQMK